MEENTLKTRVPQQQRGIETRNRIFEAARVLFCRDGFNGTNAKEITAEAGVSVGSFYAYFKDKKQLFMEVTEVHMKEAIISMLDGIKELPAGTVNRMAIVRSIIKVIANIHKQAPELHREIEALKYTDPDILALNDEINTHFNKRFISILAQFKDQLRISDLAAAVQIISCAVQETIHSTRILNSPISEERLIDALADMIHRYLFISKHC